MAAGSIPRTGRLGAGAPGVPTPAGSALRTAAGGLVDLGAVEAGQAAGPAGKEEAGRVEPRLCLPVLQLIPGPAALLGVVGEGRRVHRQPLVLVPAGHEVAQRDPVRQPWLWQRLGER